MAVGIYDYPQRDDKTWYYLTLGSLILGFILLWVLPDIEVGLLFGGPLISAVVKKYQELEGADYIGTHYKGKEPLGMAMRMAKDVRKDSIETWLVGGAVFIIAWIAGPIATILVGLGNLANFIMIFIAHGRYKELRKALLQVAEKGNTEIAVKL